MILRGKDVWKEKLEVILIFCVCRRGKMVVFLEYGDGKVLGRSIVLQIYFRDESMYLFNYLKQW